MFCLLYLYAIGLYFYRPVSKNMLQMEAGGCVLYISQGLIHRLQYLIDLIKNQEPSSFTALQTGVYQYCKRKIQLICNRYSNCSTVSGEVLGNRSNRYAVQDISYNLKMSNITIKLLPLCRDFGLLNIPKVGLSIVLRYYFYNWRLTFRTHGANDISTTFPKD